jgi:hypothetical protein
MLPSYSQYSPQGLNSAFAGFPGAGAPQLGQGQFGPHAAHVGNSAFGQEFGAGGAEQHFVATLTQLAQQVALQSAATQQFSAALLQLVQQLALQGQNARFGLGQAGNGALQPTAIQPTFGFGQPLGAQGGQLPGVFGGQFGGPNPHATAQGAYGTQGMYGGFNPLAQPWANPQSWVNRPQQTIQ